MKSSKRHYVRFSNARETSDMPQGDNALLPLQRVRPGRRCIGVFDDLDEVPRAHVLHLHRRVQRSQCDLNGMKMQCIKVAIAFSMIFIFRF